MNAMDLVTLIAACALSVNLKVMHAVIWQQSGGEPWSFSLPGDSQPQVYSTLQDAVRTTRALPPDVGRVRVGLTGLPTEPRSTTAAMFAPCPNITFAARRIMQWTARCKTASSVEGDTAYCGIAAYRGSWDRPDTKFADAATVEKGNAPNLDMPRDAYFDPADIGWHRPIRDLNVDAAASADISDDRQLGWSSALFPARPSKPEDASQRPSTRDRPAKVSQPTGQNSARATAAKLPPDSLFVPTSNEGRP
jgi:hypothetical protein